MEKSSSSIFFVLIYILCFVFAPIICLLSLFLSNKILVIIGIIFSCIYILFNLNKHSIFIVFILCVFSYITKPIPEYNFLITGILEYPVFVTVILLIDIFINKFFKKIKQN